MKSRLLSALSIAAALYAAPVSAADLRMPVKAPPPAPPPLLYNWSGFYIGGHIGGAKAERCLSIFDYDTEVCGDRTGWLGGGQLGFNFQTGQFVFGVELSGSWSDIGGDSNQGAFPNNVYYSSDGKSLLMLTGRLGFAADRALFYITGGGAWARNSVDLYANGGVASVDFDRQGWTIGGGFEYGFTPNWSFAGQYNFVDLGSRDVFFALPNLNASISNDLHVFTLRMNYRFGGWGGPAVAARY